MAKKAARDPVKVTKNLVKQVMAAMGSKGGKRSLETMTPEERIARAKKASRRQRQNGRLSVWRQSGPGNRQRRSELALFQGATG